MRLLIKQRVFAPEITAEPDVIGNHLIKVKV